MQRSRNDIKRKKSMYKRGGLGQNPQQNNMKQKNYGNL